MALVVIAGAMMLLPNTSSDSNQATLKLHGATHNITILRTEAELQKGLSGTSNLPEGSAMVFVFPRDDKWGIWMKDMNYAIDIVWLNKDKKVVHMVKDAQPSSYPSTTFAADGESRYVIELPSGTIERTGITKGDTADMPSGI